MEHETKKGWVEIGGQSFYAKSSWESNIAAYYEFLKQIHQIKFWIYEPQTFWFEGIKRGVCSYLPDFKITNIDDTHYFSEVKGFWDDKSKTKLKRMAKYFPEEKIEVIDSARYHAIAKNKSLYPEWGAMERSKIDPSLLCTIDGCNNVIKDKGFCKKHHDQIYGK